MSEQSKALELADLFEKVVFLTDVPAYIQKHHADAARQLRDLVAENAALRAQLSQGEPYGWAVLYDGYKDEEGVQYTSQWHVHIGADRPLDTYSPDAEYFPVYTAPQQAPVDEREAFEKEMARRQDLLNDFTFTLETYLGEYVSNKVQAQWVGWQARAALKPEAKDGEQ